MNAKGKLSELKARKFGDDFTKSELLESFSGKVSDELLYVAEAMKPVERSYTENTYKQCERVQNQLKTNIDSKHSGIKFEYQGSVPLNTHIKRYSDVDMLVATGRYYWTKAPLLPINPYNGDAKNDLIELRNDMVTTIRREFPEVTLDNTGGKAVAICGGSLNRKMDLVPISWLHNVNSINTHILTNRGIKLYDNKDMRFIENYPFIHIYRCDEKDSYVDRRYKRIVRYVKNVQKDSDRNINISSYDATSLMYHLGNSDLILTLNNPGSLSALVETFLLKVIGDINFQLTAKVPNETRLLFCNDGLKLQEVEKLYQEIKEINYGVLSSYLSIDPYRKQSFDRYFQTV